MTRLFTVVVVLSAACHPLFGAPVNDHFASRIAISSSTVTGTNIDATEEAGENTRSDLFGATVWWSWQAPASEWVKVDTVGSSFDTVLQISTGSTVTGQTVVAFNDQLPGQGGQIFTSSISFMATAGTAYNIAVGGWNFFGAETGDVTLRIARGAAATPAYFPASLTFSPVSANVTDAAVDVTAPFVIQSATGTGTGVAGVGFGWENSVFGDGDFAGLPAFWSASLPQSGSPQTTFTVRRFSEPDDRIVFFKIVPDDSSGPFIFTGPNGGSGYALPAPPAAIPTFTVVNDGPVDTTLPALTAFSIPVSANVTTAPGSLAVSATITDAPAGVDSATVFLISPSTVQNLVTTLTRTAGTPQNGTWTGNVAVPLLYPTDNYGVFIVIEDAAGNRNTYGEGGIFEIPGGDKEVAILGGSAYERWAYTFWFAPGDVKAGLEEDADSDGNPNLISYAFNLSPNSATGGAGSLPVVTMTGTGATRRLQISYIRRKNDTNSGITYSPQFTSNLSGVWQTVSGGVPTLIDSIWERVVVEDTVGVSAEGRRFARVKVEYQAPEE